MPVACNPMKDEIDVSIFRAMNRNMRMCQTTSSSDTSAISIGEYDDCVYSTPSWNKVTYKEGEEIKFTAKWITQPKESLKPLKAPAKVGRNEPCPCGSNKKHKKCCLKE